MQFRIVNFRDAGYLSIMCDCGAEFFETSEAIDHVIDEHCFEENLSETVALAKIAKLLSPNPLFILGGGHAAEQ
jgi:hypothetical protein